VPEIFNRQFNHIGTELLQDLNTLETEGVVYGYKWQAQDTGFVYTRLRLTPAEIVDYIDAAIAYEEFERHYQATRDPSVALSRISNSKIQRRVEDSELTPYSRNPRFYAALRVFAIFTFTLRSTWFVMTRNRSAG